MTERQIHQAFNVWLRERSIPYIESRMDRKSTILKGLPDYCVTWMGRCVYIEIKTAKGKLSDTQRLAIDYIRRSGNPVEICRSVAECVEACHNILLEGQNALQRAPEGKEWPLKRQFEGLKQTVSAVGTANGHVPGNGSELPLPGDRAGLYIADWQKVPWVCRRSTTGPDELLHKAEPIDLQILPRK